MKSRTFFRATLSAMALLVGVHAQADNMASIAITPATGKVTLTPQWSLGGGLAGFHLMSQDLSLGGGANQFYSIAGTPIPSGGDTLAFNRYIAASGAATPHADIGSKLTPNAYSALTSADPDVGYGPVNMYMIHHKDSGDYFTALIPSSGTASAVTDLKPMSGPGGPATLGDSGYFGLTFAASNLGYGLNHFYYLRTDAVTGFTKFGTLDPALLGTSADKFDLGIGGHNALAFTGSDVGYGTDKMYYLRLDPITGFTILGTLHPVSGRASDIANLGSVFSTLTFVPGDVGFGSGRFYTTGAVNTTWQSVSFAAIDDRLISAGSFTVTPSASSTLPVTLSVVPGSIGAASISGPVAGVFTVTPTAPGLITLQATQAGSLSPAFEYNMLRQSFTATGTATLAITTQPVSQSAVIASTATLSVSASGTSALSYQWRKAGANIAGNASATTDTLSLANVQAGDAATYDVVITNASGSILSDPVTLTVTTAEPVITNSSLSVGATVGTAFNFAITASGTPTSYAASPLPAGLSIVAATGVISGTPSAAGTTSVLLGATNATGTGNATLTITVAAAGVAPIVTNSPLTAGATVGSPFSFAITASGSPTSYTASPLPAGLSIVAATGVISGTPTSVGTTSVLLGATNATGTGNATLTITVAAAGVAPIVTNNPLTAGATVGTPFSFLITASGSPTSYSASPLPAGLSLVTTTGAITGTPTATGTTSVLLGATNATGTGNATLTITVAAAGVAPVITNSPLSAAGTVGTPFSFAITASGSPSSYTATPLPAGLSIAASTGVISGTPTATGTTSVLLGATNANGTSNATLTITVAAAGVAPVIANNPLTAAGTVGTPFSFTIAASGSPSAYAATPLPAGLTVVAATGVISGTPTAAGTTSVLLGATNAKGTGNATLTITVAAAGVAPIIANSPLTAAGTIGTPFSFVITASGSPTAYAATPLPAGLSIVATTGAITGTPTTAGSTAVLLSATNANGTGTATLAITVVAAGAAPSITNSPLTAAGTVGTPFSFVTTASGSPTTYAATPLPAGLSIVATTGAITGTPTTVGTTSVLLSATNSVGTGTATVTITVAAAPTVPVITSPSTADGTAGTPFVPYVVEATGVPTSYTATDLPAGLTLNPTTGEITGTPTGSGTSVVTITATNSAGSSTFELTITVEPAPSSRIVNFSARALSGPGEQTLITGFVIAGGEKNLLVRGLGPTLSQYGVVNVLTDPMLTLHGPSGAVIGTNDDWQTGTDAALIASTGARVGASALPAGSKDSALLFVAANGAHTTSMLRPVAANGVALAEIYDTDESTEGGRLVNVSARMNVTAGEGTLIAGFVIEGNATKDVLIRGLGPDLTPFGVSGVLADPMITVYSGNTSIATNDDWETGTTDAAEMTALATRLGAGALSAGSKDAALVITLAPGIYTVHVTGVGGTTGVALVEVFDAE